MRNSVKIAPTVLYTRVADDNESFQHALEVIVNIIKTLRQIYKRQKKTYLVAGRVLTRVKKTDGSTST